MFVLRLVFLARDSVASFSRAAASNTKCRAMSSGSSSSSSDLVSSEAGSAKAAAEPEVSDSVSSEAGSAKAAAEPEVKRSNLQFSESLYVNDVFLRLSLATVGNPAMTAGTRCAGEVARAA